MPGIDGVVCEYLCFADYCMRSVSQTRRIMLVIANENRARQRRKQPLVGAFNYFPQLCCARKSRAIVSGECNTQALSPVDKISGGLPIRYPASPPPLQQPPRKETKVVIPRNTKTMKPPLQPPPPETTCRFKLSPPCPCRACRRRTTEKRRDLRRKRS